MTKSTATLKRYKAFKELHNNLVKCGIKVEPYKEGSPLVIKDEDFGNRKIIISMINLNQLRVTISLFNFEYGKDIDSKRNAIKTARDVFDFYNDLVVGDLDKVSTQLSNTKPKVAPLGILYANRYGERNVEVFSHFPVSYVQFNFSAPEILLRHKAQLDHFCSLIEIDVLAKHPRWDKEVFIGKQWWRH